MKGALYKRLGLEKSVDSTKEEIEEAYRLKIKEWNERNDESLDLMDEKREIDAAYEVLKSVSRRKEYDEMQKKSVELEYSCNELLQNIKREYDSFVKEMVAFPDLASEKGYSSEIRGDHIILTFPNEEEAEKFIERVNKVFHHQPLMIEKYPYKPKQEKEVETKADEVSSPEKGVENNSPGMSPH